MIIPTAILNQIGLEHEADLGVEDGALVIRPPQEEIRADWSESSRSDPPRC